MPLILFNIHFVIICYIQQSKQSDWRAIPTKLLDG